MGLIGSNDERVWKNLVAEASVLITRAAQHQLDQAKIANSKDEALRLWKLYGLSAAHKDWREFGAIAFHLSAAFPPDLAYVIIYTFREFADSFNSDPVPRVMAALENLGHFRPEKSVIHLEKSPEVALLFSSPTDRAAQAMRILTREVSTAPYPYATGIYDRFDIDSKRRLMAALEQFNPRAADLLSKGSRSWMRTPTGIFRLLWRALLGSD